MDLIGWLLLILVGVVACAAAPTVARLLIDMLAKKSIEAHNRRTQYVLARMRLLDMECEREIDRGIRAQEDRSC